MADSDTPGSSKKELVEAKYFMRKNLEIEFSRYFGLTDAAWIDRVTNNWFHDENNYDGRWNVIWERAPEAKKILDVAAGCGTFLVYGLARGYDAWGVEPEPWKREYLAKKVLASNYPARYLDRVVSGVGEALPFDDESFDLVTTYQTLEHVQDVNLCVLEMLRVLKPGGILYIKAPDYNCFFEPHYRVPFLPKMNKKVASAYLRALGRPTLGLQTLRWVTEKRIIGLLEASGYDLRVERTALYHHAKRERKIQRLLPTPVRHAHLARILNLAYELKIKAQNVLMIGRQEKHIDLWVTKIA